VRTFYICLPVYNEEMNLENCLISIDKSLKNIKSFSVKTFICLNGCSDKSEKVALDCEQKYPFLNIEILKSNRGKLNAQKKIISKIPFNRKIFFIDSDTEVDKNSLSIILKEFDKHSELVAIGAFPIAKKYEGSNLWRYFLDKVLNIRSRHPMSEISRLNVEGYHKLAINDCQSKNTNKQHELKSKIFFHGRMFALRSKKYWSLPSKESNIVGDDSYLPDYIIYNYGKNRIRIRYDSMVYFKPFTSLIKHYKSYKRIYFDLRNLKSSIPKFEEIRAHSRLILDKNYIMSQNLKNYIDCLWDARKIWQTAMLSNGSISESELVLTQQIMFIVMMYIIFIYMCSFIILLV